MIQKLFGIFYKKDKPVIVQTGTTEPAKVADSLEPKSQNLFYCHHCGNGFEVTAKMQFSTMANKIGGGQVQAIGVQCPKCQKTCIYG
jgi:hypothetical protein